MFLPRTSNQKPRRARALNRLTSALMTYLSIACFSASFAAELGDTNKPFIRSTGAPPPGFEALTEIQTTEADIFYAGEYLLSTLISYDLQEVTIDDPEVIIHAIPTIKTPALIAAELAIAQPTNAHRVCHRRSKTDCGELQPSVVGLIFDESRFRVDVFLHPDQLLTQAPALQRYLPAPDAGLSLLHDLSFTASGRGSAHQANLTSESLLAHEAIRLRTRYGFSNNGFNLFEASLQWDEPDREFELGSFRTVGRSSAFVGDLDLLGLRVGSSTNTRTDLENALGTPLFVFLSQRSRVDVLRNGELIDSRFYPPGNQQLDTSNLPDGAYEITLRIVENNGDERLQRQFFVRNTRLPAQGEYAYRAEIGVLANTTGNQTPNITNIPLVRAGISTRLSQYIGLEGELTHVGDLNFATTGLFYFAPDWQLHAGFLASTEGDLGYSLRGTRSGPQASWSFDYVQVDAAEQRINALADFLVPEDEFDPFFNPSLLPDSFTQASTSVAFPLYGGRGILRSSLNKRRGTTTDAAIGFSFIKSILQRGKLIADLNIDTNLSQRNSFARIGVSLRVRGAKSFTTITPQAQYLSGTDANPFEARFNANWTRNQRSERYGSTQSGLFLQHEPSRTSIGGRLVNQSRWGNSALELAYQNSETDRGLNYSTTNRFSLVTKEGQTAWGGGERNLAAAVVTIDADAKDSVFNILVDNRVVGQASPNDRGLVSLRPYNTYDIQVRPAGDKILNYDESIHRVTVYPGNVHALTFSAHPITVIVGQALFADGSPVASARITDVDAFAASDAQGWFQLELTKTQTITLRQAAGTSCTIELPAFSSTERLRVLDPLVCQRK